METDLAIKSTARWSSNSLKLIAIAAMLIDHIAWAFIPTLSPLGQIMHVIGRITAPVMCYFIAEGYYRTRNVKRYALRLAVFAAVSYLPFLMFETGKLPTLQTAGTWNVIYTLLCGLLALWAWDKMTNRDQSIMVIVGLCFLASFGDWSIFGVLYVLAFGMNHGDLKQQIKWFSIVSLIMLVFSSLPYIIMNIVLLIPSAVPFVLQMTAGRAVPPFYAQFFQAGVFLAVPILLCYNGQRGGGKYGKWIFYIFYPLHLTVLVLLKLFLIK